ncbi:short-chain dehydrogenase [Apiospora marii]|uniref:short-chain dehydrogenase n=1 Tax=Apiospora marii TaxID=335849 RepID=UPI00312F2F3B
MAGTIILTGANGSLGLRAADYLLKTYPKYDAVFNVRDVSDTDPNTRNLRSVISQYPQAKASVHQVDHADLSAVHEFASFVSASVAAKDLPPLKSIICNAIYWNLVGDPELTVDGYDKTIQVSHIAHVALVMRLIGSFADDGGRVVLFSSVGHYRKPNAMTHLLPELPDETDKIVHPTSGDNKQAYGFQRYATGKFMITTWMYSLNHHLQANPKLKNITAIAVNPGDMGDSRAFATNTPLSIRLVQALIVKPFLPLITRMVAPTFRSAAAAAVDVVELAVDRAHRGERGYFTMLDKDSSDPMTMDEEVQEVAWRKSLEWAKITKNNTAPDGGVA